MDSSESPDILQSAAAAASGSLNHSNLADMFSPSMNEQPSNRFQRGSLAEWQVGERYQLVRILGHGSYGEVAEALDLRLIIKITL
jgi:hypothetical protein